MNKTDALSYSSELLEAAADGDWGSLLQLGLDADLLEHLRQLQQINVEITKLESREKQMNDSFVGRLQLLEFDDPATDGGDGPATPNVSDANRSQPLEPLEPATQTPRANTSDAKGSAQSAPSKPPGGNLMDLALPT